VSSIYGGYETNNRRRNTKRGAMMTKQEFYQKLHDSMSSKFDSLNENWQAITGSLIEIQQGGTVSNELAVTYLAHSVQMLGLRLQYLQSTMKALAGGQIKTDPNEQ
jgi:hypothetical protein